jgi:3-dehydroquinate synthase
MLGETVAAHTRIAEVPVITDAAVWAAHGAPAAAALEAAGLSPRPLVLEPGEATKNWQNLARVADHLLACGVSRRDCVVAFGGGVIGDLAGFAAAIVNRGVGFVQVPTTLLAMVDSSVGGKTAINVAAGKNLVGAFHQPRAVVADTDLLETLPPRELRAGWAEIVKYGLIDDPEFFAWCETNGAAVLALDPAAVAHAVAHSVSAKARVVAADEHETQDLRALLNLGHTFGHALEAETGYGGRLLHGEAVALGMTLAFRFSAARGRCPAADALRVCNALQAAGLPTELAEAGIGADAAPRLVAHMGHDKKREGATLPFILARGIGEAYVARDVTLAEVEGFLAADA